MIDGNDVRCSAKVKRVLMVAEDLIQGKRVFEAWSLEFEGRPSKDWLSSCLSQFSSFMGMSKFSSFMGMSTKGFKEEILTFLQNLLKRKGMKAQKVGSKRKRTGLSRFKRELRRLECLVNFNGKGSRKGNEKES